MYDDIDDDPTVRAVRELASAVRAIAYGGTSGPTGLEALGMAISGEGMPGHDNVVRAIRDAGEATERGLYAIGEAIESGLHELAEALREALPSPEGRR